MLQTIPGAKWDLLEGTNTSPYYTDILGNDWVAAESSTGQVIPTAGTLRKLRIKLVDSAGAAVSPGTGKSYTFTLRVDGVDTTLTLTLSDAQTGGSNTSSLSAVTVAAGDRVTVKAAWANTPTNVYVKWNVEFESNTAKESIVLAIATLFSKTVATQYSAWGGNGRDTTEANVYEIVALPGVIKKLHIHLRAAPDPSGSDGLIITVRKNGVDTSLTVTVTGDNQDGSDTSNSFTVAAGDRITFKKTLSGTPPAGSVVVEIGAVFLADNDGNSPLANGAGDIALNTVAAAFNNLMWWTETWKTTDEEEFQQLLPDCKLKSLYLRLSASPGSGKSWGVVVRKNGVDTALSVTISDTDTTGNNITDIIDFAEGDYVSFKVTPSETPAAAHLHWGLVFVIPVTYPAGGLTRVTGLVYRSSPGVYTLEELLGGVSAEFSIPISKEPAPTLPPDEPLPPIPPTEDTPPVDPNDPQWTGPYWDADKQLWYWEDSAGHRFYDISINPQVG